MPPYRGPPNGRRPYKDSKYRDGDNKTITGANIKGTVDNFTTLMETITITIITVITVAHTDVAMEVLIIDLVAVDEAITKGIMIISTNSITHMMMGHK